MGRKRIVESEKKISTSVSIKRKYLDELKKYGKVSEIVENLIKNFLEKNKKM